MYILQKKFVYNTLKRINNTRSINLIMGRIFPQNATFSKNTFAKSTTS